MKKHLVMYPALFHYDIKNKIGVTFPDFPGCITCGKNEEEAIQNAQKALALHIRGMINDNETLPAPSVPNTATTLQHKRTQNIWICVPNITSDTV